MKKIIPVFHRGFPPEFSTQVFHPNFSPDFSSAFLHFFVRFSPPFFTWLPPRFFTHSSLYACARRPPSAAVGCCAGRLLLPPSACSHLTCLPLRPSCHVGRRAVGTENIKWEYWKGTTKYFACCVYLLCGIIEQPT